ncbi:ATP-binding protein [Aeromicrobium chenweiae]|uniref:histidine kinase n=1 Tax=Aeromicrobium chenweiae TaxID=2079793 RepID=A0A2S0WKJ7_9ACTN|nr:ATP-binding protein [Aeromicrobium chenweiae]AWB91863.1 histidine kinase [Aeromicrobium chenweiae]TGN32710.1 GAF domain-containing protein [Aeromicrobium chenweiae]
MAALNPDEVAENDRPGRRDRLVAAILRPTTPPLTWGVATAIALIALEILIVHLLTRVAPDSQFGALFLLGVLVISAGWDFGLAVATSVASAIAYAYVHVLENSDSLVPAVMVFTLLALLTNVLVGQSRLRAAESEQRRREADLLAVLARTMLREASSSQMLASASARLSRVLELPAPHAVLGPAEATASPGQRLIVLRDGETPVGSLLVPRELSSTDSRRIRRVVPALEALLAAARDRETLHQQSVTLARQQAALRRIATLVALRVDLGDLYDAVATEIADGIGAEHVAVVAFDSDDQQYTVLAVRDDIAHDGRLLVPGERIAFGGHNVCTLVRDTGAPAVVDYRTATGPVPRRLRNRGFLLGMGVPITIEERVWGTVVVGVTHASPAPDLQARLTDFAELVATAVHNSVTRAQLTESRARVVAAADQARRTIERDLHDGAQQRIVSLGLDLRATQAAVPADLTELRTRLDRSVDALSQIHADLQELSRGIHPAILSRGGLAAALKTLARRSPVPVSLTISIPARLPDPVEVAAYYAVTEALTNAAKYAHATEVTISAVTHEDVLELDVRDDGIGGARPGGGSGLLGLQDRIDVVGGTLTISSPPEVGTTLTIRIPYSPRT